VPKCAVKLNKFISIIWFSTNIHKLLLITDIQFNLTTAISLQAKETIFSILKDFFDTEQQDEFKEVLTTFGTAKNKLVFKSNANKFTDTFKKLFENNFIVGCQKTDLIDWIVLNFKFIYRNEGKEFKTKTVEQIISGNQTFCKKPIIEIKNGQILKIDY